MESTSDLPAKRTWCFTLPPRVFEMASCACGNHDTQWSEFAKHLWCATCEKDFIPAHAGLFDGPIPVRAAKMLGIVFDRIHLATGQIDRYDVELGKWESDTTACPPAHD